MAVRRPLVSVVMPFYNGCPDGLRRAAGSILAQSLDDLELILVDDGSTLPPVQAAARELAAADRRVYLHSLPHNQGVAAAHNHGLAQCRGAFVARMDADDESLPQRLQAQTAFLQEHPELVLCASRVRFGGEGDSARGFREYVDWSNSLLTSAQIRENRFIESPLVNPSVMWRAAALPELATCRQGDFPEDYELWLRVLDAGHEVAKVPEELVIWHDPPGRLTRTDHRYSDKAFYAVKAPYLARELQRRGCREVLVWGGGPLTRRRARLLEPLGISIRAWVDINPANIGRSINGVPVLSREQAVALAERPLILGFVGNRGARAETLSFLGAAGLCAWRDLIICA